MNTKSKHGQSFYYVAVKDTCNIQNILAFTAPTIDFFSRIKGYAQTNHFTTI